MSGLISRNEGGLINISPRKGELVENEQLGTGDPNLLAKKGKNLNGLPNDNTPIRQGLNDNHPSLSVKRRTSSILPVLIGFGLLYALLGRS